MSMYFVRLCVVLLCSNNAEVCNPNISLYNKSLSLLTSNSRKPDSISDFTS